jgi:hypothetical protein
MIMNKGYRIILSMALVLGITNIPVEAQAQPMRDDKSNIELKSISCRRLLKLNDSDKEATLVFFHGYMSGKKSELTVDVPALSEVSDKVIDHCIDNPNDFLLTVFEEYRGQ